jgi:hypothetical protein
MPARASLDREDLRTEPPSGREAEMGLAGGDDVGAEG